MEAEYTIDEAMEIISQAIERKKREIADLEKRMGRFKREDRISEMRELIDYLKADVTAYITVLADMKDDDSLLDLMDDDGFDPEDPMDTEDPKDGETDGNRRLVV